MADGTRSPEERFWRQVDKRGPDECWPWTGSTARGGYGRFRVGSGKRQQAHCFAYELLVGPIPDGKVLDHFRCDNPPCCNPSHVRPTTQLENVLRANSVTAWNLAKTECPKGHPYDETNTVALRNGGRSCRACNALRLRERRAAKGAPVRLGRRRLNDEGM